MQVTGASSTIGVNPQGGAVFFHSRHSPVHAAKQLWGMDPRRDELPNLQLSSDLAWCFWNRAQKDPGNGGMQHIKYFFVTNLVNDESQRLINRALGMVGKQPGIKWPGVEFGTESEAGKALLGMFSSLSAYLSNGFL